MNEKTPLQENASNPDSFSMKRLISMAIGVRVFVDTGIQIFSPFLSAFAKGLGTDIVTLGAINSIRSLTGLAGPVYASLTDRIGYRRTMQLTLLIGAIGMFIIGFSGNLWVAAVGMFFMGLGVFSFAPVLQAYMSTLIPYHRRARGLSVVEYAWALASIIGLSLSGYLIGRFGWRVPFWILGSGLLVATIVTNKLPATNEEKQGDRSSNEPLSFRRLPHYLTDFLHLQENTRSAWGAILVGALIVYATANMAIVFGTWLSREYGLTTAQIGLVAMLLGLFELVGSILVSVFGDRLGKYRTVRAGTAASVIAYLLLPFLNVGLTFVVLGLIVWRFTFEVAMVANISLLSEQIPSQRAKVMTLGSAAVTVGAAFASLSGPFAYSSWGIFGVGFISAGAALVATILLMTRVSESQTVC